MGRENLPDEILVWDTETTGVDVEQDRILTCYAMLQRRDGTIAEDYSWTIDPGVEVPTGASDVHGMTTEWIREHGNKDAGQEVHGIFSLLGNAAERGIPIVAFNLRYDLSILHYELIRHGTPWGVEPILEDGVFYDALVHDKWRDKFRKGPRKLGFMCKHYGIEFNEEDAHDAKYDVLKTGELSWKLLARDRVPVVELQRLLREAKEEQDASLEAYLRRSKDRNARVERGWPLIAN